MIILALGISWSLTAQEIKKEVYPGADERTPSLSQYFSWINNTNEGSTEAQTLANLDFFQWLQDEYGAKLDIYVISAGAIDKARWYGSMDSPEFKRQFPNGFDPIYQKAKAMGTRLGTWGGPDGFGNTPEEEQARIDMMVKLCRDYEFRLLKFDAVVGQLRDEKQDAFIRMMTECRKYSPDLILLNHRLNLGPEALKQATTTLWGGAETYIDVHMPNWQVTAPHHRATAISRDVVPNLMHLTEDHGVCLSSCLDYWQDDLILQAFNRSLILSPQLYGNPWFLRDDEYPKLARIFNLARKYGPIMVDGLVLPEEKYGEKAVSRGDGKTRLITLRNVSWEPVTVNGMVGEEIGITKNGRYEVRLLHPTERIIGTFKKGENFSVEVAPFRSALVLVCPKGEGGVDLPGSDFEIVQDVPGKPIKINILDNLYKESYPKRIGELIPCAVPQDAEALYEATVFAADNNALEIRSLLRSGPSSIPKVNVAREAFLNQPLFADRGLWDRYLFDDDLHTAFYVSRRSRDHLINGGSLRLDLGEPVTLDELVMEVGSEHSLQPWKSEEASTLEVSDNLRDWTQVIFLAGKTMRVILDAGKPIRYIRVNGTPDRILEINGYLNGKKLDRSKWRASHLFSQYRRMPAEVAWTTSAVLDEIPDGGYLSVCLDGKHGVEGAYAAIRVDGQPVGAPDRSPSYPCEPWEYPPVKAESHYTYYIPLTQNMVGKKIDIMVLGMKGGLREFQPSAWLCAGPDPYVANELVIK